MARLLVTGRRQHLAAEALLGRLVAKARQDGHDATVTDGDLPGMIADADGVIAVLDDADAATGAVVAYAHASGKPVLGLGRSSHDLSGLCHMHLGTDEASWFGALEPFYEEVRPFAGRVVRDGIPDLVREAGHQVAFREVPEEERPRFLKQKVAAEAKELLKADVGSEKEEIADVLEALEAFIVSRSFDRDDLKRIKEAKRKRRGGFGKVYVVESTAAAPADP